MNYTTRTIPLNSADRDTIVKALRYYAGAIWPTNDTKANCFKLADDIDGSDVDIHQLIEHKK